jgi:hypothetical protein
VKKDRRQFLRFNDELKAPFKILPNSNKIVSTLCNTSRYGFGLTTPVPISVGMDIRLEIYLPGERLPIPVESRVAWSESDMKGEEPFSRFGVKVQKMDPFDRSYLLDHAYDKWLNFQKRLYIMGSKVN